MEGNTNSSEAKNHRKLSSKQRKRLAKRSMSLGSIDFDENMDGQVPFLDNTETQPVPISSDDNVTEPSVLGDLPSISEAKTESFKHEESPTNQISIRESSKIQLAPIFPDFDSRESAFSNSLSSIPETKVEMLENGAIPYNQIPTSHTPDIHPVPISCNDDIQELSDLINLKWISESNAETFENGTNAEDVGTKKEEDLLLKVSDLVEKNQHQMDTQAESSYQAIELLVESNNLNTPSETESSKIEESNFIGRDLDPHEYISSVEPNSTQINETKCLSDIDISKTEVSEINSSIEINFVEFTNLEALRPQALQVNQYEAERVDDEKASPESSSTVVESPSSVVDSVLNLPKVNPNRKLSSKQRRKMKKRTMSLDSPAFSQENFEC